MDVQSSNSQRLLDSMSSCHDVGLSDSFAEIAVDLSQFGVCLGESFTHLLV
jgi:hypothetical protein